MSETERFDATTLELSGKTLVEASAGTGKTHAITTLVVRLVLERELEPSEILVMTFTEAATAELRTRVRRRLLRALAVLEGTAVDREEVRSCSPCASATRRRRTRTHASSRG